MTADELRALALGMVARAYLDLETGVTAGSVANAADVTIAEARAALEALVDEGHVERGHVGGYYLAEGSEELARRLDAAS